MCIIIPLLKIRQQLTISFRVKAKAYILHVIDFNHFPDLTSHAFPCSLFLDTFSLIFSHKSSCHKVFRLAVTSVNNDILMANSFLSFAFMLKSLIRAAYLTTLFKQSAIPLNFDISYSAYPALFPKVHTAT